MNCVCVCEKKNEFVNHLFDRNDPGPKERFARSHYHLQEYCWIRLDLEAGFNGFPFPETFVSLENTCFEQC